MVGHLPDAVAVSSASPYPARACRKLQLAMQEQDTILEDGQAGHVDGLGSGSQTAASLPVTEGKKGRRCALGWRLLRRQPKPVIDLEGFGTLNFAEVEGPAWPMVPYRYLEEVRVSCQFGITSRTAEHQRRAWEGQGRAGQGRAIWPLCIVDSGDNEPQEVFRGAGRQVHITIGGGEIGVCPLSFPYHAT